MSLIDLLDSSFQPLSSRTEKEVEKTLDLVEEFLMWVSSHLPSNEGRIVLRVLIDRFAIHIRRTDAFLLSILHVHDLPFFGLCIQLLQKISPTSVFSFLELARSPGPALRGFGRFHHGV